ncbi:MAG: response regulator transcription factor [Betaproteobacteria bacterium]|nr:response regulator transcription factor [Betaproteobacteria bacterium]MCC6248506.1 response regulator transcription factor [Rubrivivax sp.]MCL4697693.1 response regulator [Burkholderiaceae bacterium]
MSRLNVFVVEDSETIRQNLIATLEELAPVDVVGFADDAEGAIARLANDPAPCDLAIIDVLLRRGSGVDVLKALQGRQGSPRCVVLTNYATTLIRDHCLALGADRVFDKSAEVEHLLDYCESLAQGRGPAPAVS